MEIQNTVSTFKVRDDRPKTWGEMSDAEKGALLLAQFKGETVQYRFFPQAQGCTGWRDVNEPMFNSQHAYRIKPEPKIETVTLGVAQHGSKWTQFTAVEDGTHRITFTTTDGKPATGTFVNESGDVIEFEENGT